MSPFAYGLREHEIFQTPKTIDRSGMIDEPSTSWAEHIPGKPATVSFLPLAETGGSAGWCTYAKTFDNAPDVEIMCGGKNSKLPSAAAIWRQGNLLHFGFQQDPGRLNDVGRDLLENCIVYIAEFANDRPLGAVRSVFRPGPRQERRTYLKSVLKSDAATAAGVAKRFFSGERRQQLAAMAIEDVRPWLHERWHWLVPQPDGRLDVCPDLRALRLDVRAPEFLDNVMQALAGDHDSQAAACRILHRHCGEGPRGQADPACASDWISFLTENAPYLFFSEHAGCVWLLDPLAKARAVASAELRGPLRRG